MCHGTVFPRCPWESCIRIIYGSSRSGSDAPVVVIMAYPSSIHLCVIGSRVRCSVGCWCSLLWAAGPAPSPLAGSSYSRSRICDPPLLPSKVCDNRVVDGGPFLLFPPPVGLTPGSCSMVPYVSAAIKHWLYILKLLCSTGWLGPDNCIRYYWFRRAFRRTTMASRNWASCSDLTSFSIPSTNLRSCWAGTQGTTRKLRREDSATT